MVAALHFVPTCLLLPLDALMPSSQPFHPHIRRFFRNLARFGKFFSSPPRPRPIKRLAIRLLRMPVSLQHRCDAQPVYGGPRKDRGKNERKMTGFLRVPPRPPHCRAGLGCHLISGYPDHKHAVRWEAPGRGNCRGRTDRGQELGQLYYQLVDQLVDQLCYQPYAQSCARFVARAAWLGRARPTSRGLARW